MKIINTKGGPWQEEYVLMDPIEGAGAEIVLDFDQGQGRHSFRRRRPKSRSAPWPSSTFTSSKSPVTRKAASC